MDAWRHNFSGVTRARTDLGLELFGAIDDLWHDGHGLHFVVDYKATSKKDPVSLDADWQIAYKRQVEFYQWLLRGNGLTVADRAYFVYANGVKDDRPFDDLLRFETKVLPYDGNAGWVEPTLLRLRECLERLDAPPPASSCATCAFVKVVKSWE
jgi:hypothetical protein